MIAVLSSDPVINLLLSKVIAKQFIFFECEDNLLINYPVFISHIIAKRSEDTVITFLLS